MPEEPKWPHKIGDINNHHLDSTFWHDFRFRNDGIIIATYAKSGTTWLQQIVNQLIFEGQEGLPCADEVWQRRSISVWRTARRPAPSRTRSAAA